MGTVNPNESLPSPFSNPKEQVPQGNPKQFSVGSSKEEKETNKPSPHQIASNQAKKKSKDESVPMKQAEKEIIPMMIRDVAQQIRTQSQEATRRQQEIMKKMNQQQ